MLQQKGKMLLDYLSEVEDGKKQPDPTILRSDNFHFTVVLEFRFPNTPRGLREISWTHQTARGKRN